VRASSNDSPLLYGGLQFVIIKVPGSNVVVGTGYRDKSFRGISQLLKANIGTVGALSLGVKQPKRESNHSLPSSSEVKIVRSYTSTPPVSLHVVGAQLKAQGKLYL